jgi:hypothetical protein
MLATPPAILAESISSLRARVIAWLERLPTAWLVVVVFAGTAVVAAAILLVALRVAERASGAPYRGLSPGLLSPMGLVFGLIVGFLVAGLWGDLNNARDAVDREASALRSSVLVASATLPRSTSERINALIAQHIHDAATKEWPAMADQRASLTVVSGPLSQALRVALTLHPANPGQATGQRELVSSLESALDARRQRIIVSQSSIGWVKWLAIIALAALTLLAIAFVHAGNRRTAALAVGIFGGAVAVTLVLIASQAVPFRGEFRVKPDALIQVLPRR